MTKHFDKPDTYAVWSKNENIRYHSTSGGAFTEFAEIIVAGGGFVAGAQYNSECLVEHVLVSDIEGIEKIRQSKYMQSDLKDIFKEVKAKLIEGKTVGFCGAPCQIAGLYAYLGKEYDNLFTMDFICRGMNSPKAFKAWLTEVEEQEKSKAIRVWFKYKDGGWKTSPKRTRVDFEDGHYKVYEAEKNLFMHGYLTTNLYIKPSCGDCRFKGVPRRSDVTFADFWGIEKELDDDRGTSMLLINSEKGREYFEKVKESINCYPRDFDEILAGNPMFLTSAKVPPKAHDFLMELDNRKFSEAIKKYTAVPLWRRVARKAKHLIKK